MPCVVDELPLQCERALEAVEHRVERRSERRDLVAPVDRNAPAQIGLGDRAGGPGELANGADDAVRELPRDERPEDEHQKPRQREGVHGLVRVGARAIVEDRRHEDAPRVAADAKRNGQVFHSACGSVDARAKRLRYVAPELAQLGVAVESIREHVSAAQERLAVHEGDHRLVARRDVSREVDVEDAPNVRPERPPRSGVDTAGQPSELGGLLCELLADPLIETNDEDGAGDEDGRDRRKRQEPDEVGEDPCAQARRKQPD